MVDADSFVGRTFGDFALLSKIGEGGFAAVYRAVQRPLERDAVVKILHGQLRTSPDVIQRFLREARLASRLDHPYAAHIYAFGVEPDGLQWLAMELVRGTPLHQLLREQGAIPLERFVPFLERLCEVVHTAHEQGIVHRDLKPANVMVLVRAGKLLPKLLDLGIAKMITLDPAPAGEKASPAGTESTMRGAVTPSTRQGALVGSPAYMAPEQWYDAATVDARTDVYALGILAYEALTGRLPFAGDTLAEMARAHATLVPQPLGAGLPPELDAVLRRALAKRPAERFGTAVELAVAFRAASGLGEQVAGGPALEETVRDVALTTMPQPIAEAVAGLDGARNLHQARDAVWRASRVVARLLGLIGLAARTRVSGRGQTESEVVSAALRDVRQRSLEVREWAGLAAELCRPFAGRRDAHPVPELVGFFLTPEGGPATGAQALEELLGLHDAAENAADVELRPLVEQAMRGLAKLLRAASFLTEYQLVVARDGRAELWAGLRRTPRAAVAVRGVALAEGKPTLCDRDGNPLLTLAPLVQVAAPAPGAAEELFLFEGKGRHGARLVALPQGFEWHDPTLWDWFRAQLQSTVSADEAAATEERPPYRGLSPFTPGDAALFFGRERAAETFLNRLRVQPLLAVVGPSGAGKSSFVQAGVLPALPTGWRFVVFRPGAGPLAALTACLAHGGLGEADTAGIVRAALARDAAALGDALRAVGERAGTLVLVVDQLEELFTLCGDAAERQVFAEALTRAARSADDPVRVVLTLRDDFLVRAEQLPALRERLGQGLQLLTTPAVEDLKRILVEPARRSGYTFEDEALPAEMVAEVADQPSALALLSFTAARLWEDRDRHFRLLRRRTYAALGGVGGALAQHAEATLAAMPHEQRALAREVFRHLVTAEGTRAVLTRVDLTRVVGGGPHADTVVERLVAARLLVASEAETGEDRVEIVHEALLAAWPRLVEWRREDVEGARMRDQLRAAAKQWHERGRQRGLLWRDDVLADFVRWRRGNSSALGETEEAFVAASVGDAARGRRLRLSLVGGAFVALAMVVVALAWMNARIGEQRKRATASAHEAKQRLVAQYWDQGRLAALAGNASKALVYFAEVRRQGWDDPALRFMIARAARSHEALALSLVGHRRRILWAEYSRDYRRIVTSSADRTARLWDAADGRPRATLGGHEGDVVMARFSPDGTRVVTVGHGLSRMWETESGRLLFSFGSKTPPTYAADFSQDGRFLVTAAESGTVTIWDARTGAALRVLKGHESAITAVGFSPDGRMMITASQDDTARLWNAATGQPVAVLRSHKAPVYWAAFNRDGSLVATAGWDNSGRVWDGRDGSPKAVLTGHTDRLEHVAFSPDGTLVVTASRDATARVWEAATGRLVSALEGHGGAVATAAFDQAGERVVTGETNGTLRVFEARTGRQTGTLNGHGEYVRPAAFGPGGRQVLSASWDGTARLWDVDRGAALLRRVVGEPRMITTVRFSPDGQRLAIANEPGRIRVVDSATGKELLAFQDHRDQNMTTFFVEFSPDGTRLITASEDKTVRIWDARSGALLQTLTGHQADVYTAVFSPDGRRVATASRDRTVVIWDSASGRPQRTLRHEGYVMTAVWQPHGRLVATASYDGSARLWDAESGALQATLVGGAGGVTDVTFSSDGTRLVSSHESGVARVWNVATGRVLGTLHGHAGLVLAAVFTQDDALIATASMDRTARVWDARTFSEVASLGANPGFFGRLSMSPDGQRVATSGADGVVRIWDLGREPRSTDDLEKLVRCRVPFRLDGERLVPATEPPSDCLGAGLPASAPAASRGP